MKNLWVTGLMMVLSQTSFAGFKCQDDKNTVSLEVMFDRAQTAVVALKNGSLVNNLQGSYKYSKDPFYTNYDLSLKDKHGLDASLKISTRVEMTRGGVSDGYCHTRACNSLVDLSTTSAKFDYEGALVDLKCNWI